MKNENNDIEEEQLYSGTYEREITEPFNPEDLLIYGMIRNRVG